MSLNLLGSFMLTLDGQPAPSLPRRVQALLALIILHRGRALPREFAADMLWTESGPQQARQSLRQALSTLRRVLGAEIVRADAESLALVPDALVADVLEFEALALSDKVSDLARCAALYHGEFLQNLTAISPRFDDWLGSERQRLAALAIAVLRRLANACAAMGDFDAALPAARRLLEFDDLDEDAHRRVIRLLGQSGRRAEALRQYEACVEILKRELTVAPERQTIELARTIRNGSDVEATPPARPQAPTIEPDRLPAAAEPPKASGVEGRRWLRAVAAVTVAACVMAVVVVAARSWPIPTPDPPVLLVVPFSNDSTVDSQDLPVAGLSSLITEELRTTYSLRTSQYRAEANDAITVPEHVAVTPSVRYVLDGTASFSQTLDIAVRLNDRNGTTVWSNRYAAPRGDVMDMAADIVSHVSRAAARDSGVFGSDLTPTDRPKQTSRELLALSTFVRHDATASGLAASQQIVKTAVELDPQNAEALALLANSYLTHFAMTLHGEDLIEADRDLESALALNQTNVLALWDKCFLLRMQQRFADALESCRRVLDVNPHHAGGLREVGHDLISLHDPADAIPWFRAAIEAVPDHPFIEDAYFGISEAEMELGHVEAATEAAYTAVQHDHWGSFAGLCLAATLEIAGRDAEAKSALTQFYLHHPEFPPDDDLAPRMLTTFSMHPQILADALRRLGLKVADAE